MLSAPRTTYPLEDRPESLGFGARELLQEGVCLRVACDEVFADELHDLEPDPRYKLSATSRAVVRDEAATRCSVAAARARGAAEAHPHEGDTIGVHVRAREEPVDGRVTAASSPAEEQLLVTKGAALSGPGKGENVVTTSGGGRAAGKVQLLLGAVEAPWNKSVGRGPSGHRRGMSRPRSAGIHQPGSVVFS